MAGLHTLQLIFHCVPLGEFVIVVAYLYVGGHVVEWGESRRSEEE